MYNLANLKIKDICISGENLVYYDCNKEDYLKKFCAFYHIDYLPDVSGRTVHKVSSEGFIEFTLNKVDTCHMDEPLFSKKVKQVYIDSVNNKSVVFVLNDKGLIHGISGIMDFNSTDLLVAGFRDICEFEQNLRRVLIDKGHSNNSIITWIKEKASAGDYHWQSRRDDLFKNGAGFMDDKLLFFGQLQCFYLNDLIRFVEEQKPFSTQGLILKEVNALRNWVSHSSDVSYYNWADEVYSIVTLKGLYKQVEMFNKVVDRLSEEIPSSEGELKTVSFS